MKIKNIETLVCSAGWRPWSFIKISTSDGIVGYSECTESFGSIRGVLGAIEDLKHLLIGRDPRATEMLFWDIVPHNSSESWRGSTEGYRRNRECTP